MSFTRRGFLSVVGGAATGYGLNQVPYRRLVGLDDLPDHMSVPGRERWVRTTCQICPGGCGMEVRTVDDRPVTVRGNLLHPISRGGLCAVGIESMHLLYSPDRLKAPLQRASARGAGAQWKPVAWDQALDTLAGRITELRAAGKADRVFLLDGYDRGLLSSLSRRMMDAIGSHNYFIDRAPSPLAGSVALGQGIRQPLAYDLENAHTILSFGTPLLEGWDSPMQGQRGVGAVRKAATEGANRSLIQLDVRRSKTAHRADVYLETRPGAFGAAALAIAYVLISQELYDTEFVAQHTIGFEDWTDDEGVKHTGFKSFVLSSCRPQDLETASGIPAREILEAAKLFAQQRPSVAIAGGEALAGPGGVAAGYAINALNALVGAIDQPGGALLMDPVPFADLGAPSAAAKEGTPPPHGPYAERDTEEMLRTIQATGEKPAILFLVHSNPFFASPQGDRFAEILGDDTIVVCFSPIGDESSQYADYILPDHTFLERWQDAVGPRTFPNAVLGLTRPVTDPLYDTRHTGDVLLDISRRASLDGIAWASFEEALRESTKSVFDARRGSVFTNEREADEIREMERRGWWIPSHTSYDSFWAEALEKGGWWDPGYSFGMWSRVFQTESRRFEFISSDLRRRLAVGNPTPQELAAKLRDLGLPDTGEQAFHPRFDQPEWFGETGEDTFVLQLTRPLVPNTAVATSMPWVREALNPRVAWDTWAELNKERSHELGISEGDEIRLVCGANSIEVRAILSEAVPRDVVVVPQGLGRKAGGRWASTRGANPLALIDPNTEELTGTLRLQQMKIRIVKVAGGTHNA